jgi:hypothetical protein
VIGGILNEDIVLHALPEISIEETEDPLGLPEKQTLLLAKINAKSASAFNTFRSAQRVAG